MSPAGKKNSHNAGFLSPDYLASIGIADAARKNLLIHETCVIVDATNMTFGHNVRIDPFVVLAARNLTVGSYVHIATGCGIYGRDEITLEDFSGLSSQTLIYSSSDDYSGNALTNPTVPEQYLNVESGPVRVGRHAILGARCTVLPGVQIGAGAAVGAGSLIKDDVAEWQMAVGVPAHAIRERSRKCLELEKALLSENELKPEGR